MNDTLKVLSTYPEIGIGTSFFSTLIGFLQVLNPILTFISLSIGVTVGLMTLYAKFKGWLIVNFIAFMWGFFLVFIGGFVIYKNMIFDIDDIYDDEEWE